MNDSENVVSLKNVKKAFGKNVVLDGIDLDVRKGEVVVICGRSGSGKSTLLRCIDQLETIAVSYTHLTLPTICSV